MNWIILHKQFDSIHAYHTQDSFCNYMLSQPYSLTILLLNEHRGSVSVINAITACSDAGVHP